MNRDIQKFIDEKNRTGLPFIYYEYVSGINLKTLWRIYSGYSKNLNEKNAQALKNMLRKNQSIYSHIKRVLTKIVQYVKVKMKN